jgi:hypothetical protein
VGVANPIVDKVCLWIEVWREVRFLAAALPKQARHKTNVAAAAERVFYVAVFYVACLGRLCHHCLLGGGLRSYIVLNASVLCNHAANVANVAKFARKSNGRHDQEDKGGDVPFDIHHVSCVSSLGAMTATKK